MLLLNVLLAEVGCALAIARNATDAARRIRSIFVFLHFLDMARRISRRVSAQAIAPASRLTRPVCRLRRQGARSLDYFTGTASGWPFGAIITTKLLYGTVLLAYFAGSALFEAV